MIISGERRIGYDAIQARIKRAASGLRTLGLAEGVPVAMMLRNDFALFEVVAASAALGSPVVPINWHLKAEEVRYILTDSGAKILVCHADLLPQIRDGIPADVRLLVVATPPELAATFGIPPDLTEVPDGLPDWDRWRDGHPETQEPARRAAAMIYTSGTTGMPKGVRRMPMP
ncbi:long-chain fatty acid--CoA ligase, partial [Bradyrhizobium sp. AT1]|uniref:AMP-binding protein n=1 Tax=Bradyrhizobium sp. AT1 TaxID=574934 RepID=UPI00079B1F5B